MSEISRITQGLRTGLGVDPTHGAVVPPVYTSTTFLFSELGETPPYDYTRCGNPTRDQLGHAIATLEGGVGPATITASGMGAITNILYVLVERGGVVVVPHDCYGGSWRLFDSLHQRGDITMVTVDFNDEQQVSDALGQSPALVWIETPSNPLLRLTDIEKTTQAAHAAGAKVVVDNTFCSPLVQRPFDFGVDAVVHSTTKYVNGHSDVVGGAVICATEEMTEEVAWWANVLGLPGGPADAALALRGLRTLAVRMEAHQRNAAAVAELFASHEAVSHVYYPGLPDHPGHELAKRQQQGFGGMVSCELAGGYEAVRRFVTGLQIFNLAESLGGVESLVAHPPTMTHAAMSEEAREVAGIREGLLRFSVGIDATEDLLIDLRAALDRAAGG